MFAVPAYFAMPFLGLATIGVPVGDAPVVQEEENLPPVCGNGKLEATEQCDDGNVMIYDGCTGCLVEEGYSCIRQPSICSRTMETSCGDGIIVFGEQCDDGNAKDEDGCSRHCAVEERFRCEGTPSRCVWATAKCGDGMVDIGEPCDDGNTVAGDGCSAACIVEAPYLCGGQPTTCHLPPDAASFAAPETSNAVSSQSEAVASSSAPAAAELPPPDPAPASASEPEPESASAETGPPSSEAYRFRPRMRGQLTEQSDASVALPPLPQRSGCGDGILLGEACDDGDIDAGDGCSVSCTVEPGYACHGVPSRCAIVCGDGVIGPDESCDDAGNAGGDGCSPYCRLESGWSCAGAPSSCTLLTQ
jgi:large repetitive protein